MTATDPGMPVVCIPHSRICKRPAPVLRQSWAGEPQWWCPGCGRALLAEVAR